MTKQYVDFTPWPDDLARRYRDRGYWIGQPLTAGVAAQARVRPDAPAIICGARSISYGALAAMSDALAARLAARGLGHGDTALVQLPNVAEFYITFLALLKLGVVPVNALYAHRARELTDYARQIGPRLLVVDAVHPLFSDGAMTDALRAIAPVDLVLRLNDPGADGDLSAWLAADPPRAAFAPTPPDQVAFFQLSGGSTGTPKLIPRTHDDYGYSVRESARLCGLDADTRFLVALPAGHNFILSSPGALGVFQVGGTVVLAPNPDPVACFDRIAAQAVTMAALVPSAVGMWLDHARQTGQRLPSLRLVQVGGASFPEAMARQVPAVLGCAVQQVFGMAEGLVNYTRLDDPPDVVMACQGRPISPDDEVRVIGPDGQSVAPGQPGQLATRGPYTIRGYYRSPDHNAQAFDADGFYLTGDLVVQRPDGNLRVVGRLKDQINRGGEKIAAEEIERLLLAHPAIRQAALIPVGDTRMGEKSCAVLVVDDGSDTDLRPVALRRWLMAQGVADYKLPDRFHMVAHLPLTAVGKVDKRTLRAAIEAGARPLEKEIPA
ncbi:(2,3-dihydroxybenzoyl)adenylate synthase [Paracoccus sp. p4-l81]|uniref:(2,3-dihydroxybenzoyl)adenylate synthase n=1 Tax=Paracoccus sp. p4-l81 TaxID=3342806 RepID=UPI0035BA5B61